MKSARNLLLLVGLALFSVSFSAHAERPKHHPEKDSNMATVKQDCAADVEKFCHAPPRPRADGVPPPPPHGCLREHLAELGPKCKGHVEAMEAKHPRPPHDGPGKPEGDVPPPPPPSPTEGSPSTSIERESSDLAEALMSARALAVGEPVSPAERTIRLASAATAIRIMPVAVELKNSGSATTAPNETRVETAPVPSKATDSPIDSF